MSLTADREREPPRIFRCRGTAWLLTGDQSPGCGVAGRPLEVEHATKRRRHRGRRAGGRVNLTWQMLGQWVVLPFAHRGKPLRPGVGRPLSHGPPDRTPATRGLAFVSNAVCDRFWPLT